MSGHHVPTRSSVESSIARTSRRRSERGRLPTRLRHAPWPGRPSGHAESGEPTSATLARRVDDGLLPSHPATIGGMDWAVVHLANGFLVGRDWLEDPLTFGSEAAVPVFAAATLGLWFLARPGGHRLWKRATVAALLSAAAVLAVNQLVANLIWARPRPFAEHPGMVHLFAGGSLDPSFPSDHAAAAFAIAVAVLVHSRRAGLAFLTIATLIACSRVVEGLHYPTDVLAGAAVGTLLALLVTYGARPVVNRLADLLGRLTDPVVAYLGRALGVAGRIR